MQRTDPVLFCSIFSVLLAATIFFVCGCDGGSSGSTVSLASETAFRFTGEPQEFIVSADVTSITVHAFGAPGGAGWNADGGGSVKGSGGLGGSVEATLPVTPGETLYIYLGGAGEDATGAGPGAGGWNGGGDGGGSVEGHSGGGGGGASDIRRDVQDDGPGLDDRILVAGGGGAGSGWCIPRPNRKEGNGGPGGGLVGGDGEEVDNRSTPDECADIAPGTGGTQDEGGETGGIRGIGGDAPSGRAGGAGGGGYWGGGASDGIGGGGGSSYVDPVDSSAITHQQGVTRGNGMIFIQEYY
jgi:hypothetical protein